MEECITIKIEMTELENLLINYYKEVFNTEKIE